MAAKSPYRADLGGRRGRGIACLIESGVQMIVAGSAPLVDARYRPFP
jgi:hypothetical protein